MPIRTKESDELGTFQEPQTLALNNQNNVAGIRGRIGSVDDVMLPEHTKRQYIDHMRI